jgi:hypothetical protein
MTNPDPFLTATPDEVAEDLERAFTTARVISSGAPWKPGPRVSDFPKEATDTAMSVVTAFLEAKDARIAELERQVESARADERMRCIAQLRERESCLRDKALTAGHGDFLLSARADSFAVGASELEAGAVPAETEKKGGQR